MEYIYELNAGVYKTFANSKRLEIIDTLRDGELNAADILKTVKTSKANLSQHMSLLVEKGIVSARKNGKHIFYRLSDGRITKACELVKEVLIKRLEQHNKLLMQLKR